MKEIKYKCPKCGKTMTMLVRPTGVKCPCGKDMVEVKK